MSFYGYAERSADSQIDWSAIGKEVTTMLQTEVTRRDKLKSDINEASKKYAQDLMNSPTGLSEDVTKRTMELSEGASEIMLMQDRLLKTGQLKPKNYLTVRENLKTDTKTYYDLFKSFQDYYKLKMERMEKNDSSGLEPKLFAETEGFGAFNKSKVYINPVTGHITIGKTKMVKGPDGNEVQEMTGENFTVGEFKNFISNNIDRFDDVKAIDAVAKSIGEKVIGAYTLDKKLKSYVTKLIQSRTGEEFKALKDDLTPEQREIALNIKRDFKRQLNLEMQAVFSNDYNTSSFLGDAVKMDENGDMYDWAWDFEEGSDDDNKILISKDPNSNFLKFNFESEKGKKQKERAINIFEDRVRLRLASSMTETGKQQYTPPRTGTVEKNIIEGAAESQTYLSWIQELIEGNRPVKEGALTKFNNLSPDTADFLELSINSDGTSDIVSVGIDGKRTPLLEDWENKSNEEIADAMLRNKVFPTLSANALKNYEKIIQDAGVAGFKKKSPYDYMNPNAKEGEADYHKFDGGMARDKYVRSAGKEYEFLTLDDMEVMKKGANINMITIWKEFVEKGMQEQFHSGASANEFLRNFNASYLGQFYDPKIPEKRNPFKSIIKNISQVPKEKSDAVNAFPSSLGVGGREFINVFVELDPKYGESFYLPMAEEIFQQLPQIMKRLQLSAVPGENEPITKFTREALYKALGGFDNDGNPSELLVETKIKEYNDGLDGILGTKTKKPFRKYDPKVDIDFKDYQAKKLKHEQNQ